MRFSDQFESRFAEMLTHYPTKRSVLVPTLLYAQDEIGYLSDEAIKELADRLELTELEVRNVISYYSMLTMKPRGKYNVQICTNIACQIVGAWELLEHAEATTARVPMARPCTMRGTSTIGPMWPRLTMGW